MINKAMLENKELLRLLNSITRVENGPVIEMDGLDDMISLNNKIEGN